MVLKVFFSFSSVCTLDAEDVANMLIYYHFFSYNLLIFFMKRGFVLGRFEIFDIEPRRNSYSDGLVADLTSSNDLLVGHKLAAIKSR